MNEEKKAYLDIFREHYPNVDCEQLYGDYCPAGFFEEAPDDRCAECTGDCKLCWDKPAEQRKWCESGDYYIPESWNATKEDVAYDEEELQNELSDLSAAVDEINEKHVRCPCWNIGNTLYNKGYGIVSFNCQKHSEEFDAPRKLKQFICTHCYSGNHIWCSYFHEQEKPQNTSEEISTAAPDVIDTQAGEVADTFNYAVLSTELGDYLRHKEEQLKNEYMNFTANCGRIFAEAQEKLAGDNHYNGLFEKWIKSMGFAKTTVYRMIDVHKFYSSQIGTSKQADLFNSLSKSLQYEIAKPSAPPELVEQVMNGDITTHKDYIALKKELESQKQLYSKVHDENQELRRDRVSALNRADNAERELSGAKAEIEKLNREADEADREYDAMADRECHYETEICELKHQIKELEAQPRDVAFDADELNRRLTEASTKLQNQAAEQIAEERRDFSDKLNRMEEERDRLENRIAELESSSDIKDKDREIAELKEQIGRLSDKKVKTFAVKLTIDEFEELMSIAENSGNVTIANAVSKAQILRI